MKGKKGNFEYVEKEGSMTRETTMEEQGVGKRLEFDMDAKKHALRNSFTKSRMFRADEPSGPDLADILAMLGVGGGKTASGQEKKHLRRWVRRMRRTMVSAMMMRMLIRRKVNKLIRSD